MVNESCPLVSIIIRTCNRPTLLKQALESVEGQTFKDYEVIIVEDGGSSAKHIIIKFPQMPIKYLQTDRQVGRTVAANKGLELACGQLINFLDDDDILLPNHLEALTNSYKKNPDYDLFHALALERQVNYISFDPLKYSVENEILRAGGTFQPELLLYKNMFPIQAVLFKRSLYINYGGLDENLIFLEDWDLWIKYSFVGRYLFVDQLTSIYHTPGNAKLNKERRRKLAEYEKVIFHKYKEFVQYSDNRFLFFLIKCRKFGIRSTITKIIKRIFPRRKYD